MTPSHRQEFCVRWNSHLGSIGAAFPQLLAGQRFVDVTLACEGHQVHCHRLVLAACSSYFESILAENPCKHPVIILPSEIKLWEIQALVDFMYKGEVNVTQAGLPQLLRCAEQLRIRGLYGSDAALNLNQLKAMTAKANTGQTAQSMGNNNLNTGLQHDSNDEDTATNSTTTTTATAASTIQHTNNNNMINSTNSSAQNQIVIKKEPNTTTNSSHSSQQSQNSSQPSSLQVLNPANLKSLMAANQAASNLGNMAAAAAHHHAGNFTGSNDSGDESTSNAYEHYENNSQIPANALQAAAAAAAAAAASSSIPHHMLAQQHHMDSTIEEDHNYVAHDEDDSFSGAMADSEHDSTANNSMMQSMDNNCSLRRIRRSEESLEQAAKCVSKGQTFQTVSNMFNIPVSTIRFYMARKGILPKRKRGRGASNTGGMTSSLNISGAAAAANAAAVMSQALAQIKRADSPNAAQFGENPYHLMGYKMEPGTAHLV